MMMVTFEIFAGLDRLSLAYLHDCSIIPSYVADGRRAGASA